MRVFNQDPASDMGRRAAAAGLIDRRSVPIRPATGWATVGARLISTKPPAWARSSIATSRRRRLSPGTEPYSTEETRSIQAMLEHGRDATYIARVLKRPVHSVEVKIGAMMKAAPAWSFGQDYGPDRPRQAPDRPSLRQIASELGRTVHSVGSRLSHHGIRLKDLRAAGSAAGGRMSKPLKPVPEVSQPPNASSPAARIGARTASLFPGKRQEWACGAHQEEMNAAWTAAVQAKVDADAETLKPKQGRLL
jgi:hypothetical protein